MISCVVVHCISSPGLMHKVTKHLQALNEKRASNKKRIFSEASGNAYLVNGALTYMFNLNPMHLLLAGQGNTKRMIPTKKMAPINKNSTTISIIIKDTDAEYHLVDVLVRHLRPYAQYRMARPGQDQMLRITCTQSFTYVNSQVVATQLLTPREEGGQHGYVQTIAYASIATQVISYIRHQNKAPHKAFHDKCFSVRQKNRCTGTGKKIPPKSKGTIDIIKISTDISPKVRTILIK